MTSRELLSPDLLNGLEGIEQGLRQRRSLGRAGALGFLALVTFQAAVVLFGIAANTPWDAALTRWYFAIPSLLIAVALVLVIAARFWIKESRAPFRYTCRIVKFDPVAPTPDEVLPWLSHDLAELLNERIGRLSFLDHEPKQPERQEAHIHIAGEYLIRKSEDRALIEVTPRVRVGGEEDAQTLAHAVTYEAEVDTNKELVLPLSRSDYDQLLERVYFSVATRLYKQVRADVERKIALLPTRYLRATAYLHEAEDYAQSNTLDAYDDAQGLFERARGLYDPATRRLPRARLRRWANRCWTPVRLFVRGARGLLAHVVVRFGRRQAMLARTEVGLANTLVARRALARLSGRRANQIFAARALAESARERRRWLNSIDYPGAHEALFDAHVTLALVFHYLESDDRAEEELKCARAALPDRAEENARYLFAAALIEPRNTAALSLLRRSVELDPRFEIAQFEQARRTETLWQFRPGLEKVGADNVVGEYENVVRLNPGNIQAWSSLGHTKWLLAKTDEELAEAEDDFQRGLEYKEIKRETFVAGLHYSLARVTAERGEFSKAYRHYVASTTAIVGEGIAYGTWPEQHNAVVRNRVMLSRFQKYLETVKRHHKRVYAEGDLDKRILRSVLAFAQNDYGEACMEFFDRSGQTEYLDEAREAFRASSETNETYVMPRYNLCLLSRGNHELDDARRYIEDVLRREQKWPEALLEEMWVEAQCSKPNAERRKQIERDIVEMTGDLDRLRELKDLARRRRKNVAPDDLGEKAAPKRSGLGADAAALGSTGASENEIEDEIARTTDALRRKGAEKAKLQEELAVSNTRVLRNVRALVPHEWLWRGDDPSDPRFRWKTVRQPRWRSFFPPATYAGHRTALERRWEQDFGDLHVLALETWASTRVLSGADQTEHQAFRILRRRRPRDTEALLNHLEDHFWPDRVLALDARLQLKRNPVSAQRLGSLSVRALAFDPAHYRMLVFADERLPPSADGQPDKRRKAAFLEALSQREVAPRVLQWLGPRLEILGAYADALKAYDRVLEVQRRPAAVEPEVILGRARALCGVGRLSEGTAALDARRDGFDSTWRREFVASPAVRARISDEAERGESRQAEGSNTRGRRLPGLAKLSLPHRLRGDRDDGDDDSTANGRRAEPDLVQHEDTYRTLVSWLQREHRVCIEASDFEGARDAAGALLEAARTRYARSGPNRTTPLPNVLVPGGSLAVEPDQPVVPLTRPLALEVDPRILSDAKEGFWRIALRDIPALCEQIHAETGVPIPGVDIAAITEPSEDVERAFRILVHELPAADGTIRRGEAESVIRSKLEEAIRTRLHDLVTLDELIRFLRGMPDPDELVKEMLESDVAKVKLVLTVRAAVVQEMLPVDIPRLLRQRRTDLANPLSSVDDLLESIQAQSTTNGRASSQGERSPGLEGTSWSVKQ